MASTHRTAVRVVDAAGDSAMDETNDALRVNIVAGSSGGTEYTEGDTDASITGTAVLWEDTGDTLRAVSAAKPLPVSDAGGSLTVDNATISVVGSGTEATALRVTVASDSTGVLSVDDNGSSLTVDGTVTANAGTNLNTSALALETGGNLANAATSLGVMDDWDNAASDGASVSGDVASGSTDAGEPVKIGGRADTTIPTAVTDGQRVNAWLNEYGAVYVRPQGAPTVANGQVAPTNSAATLLAARNGRQEVTFLNYGTVTVYIGIATVTTANGFALDPGASITLSTTALLQAITAAGTGAIHYIETYA